MTQTATPLTSVTAVRRAVAEVQAAVDERDFEKAHSRERDVLLGALEAIAASNAQAGHIAAEALTVTAIDYPRWMA